MITISAGNGGQIREKESRDSTAGQQAGLHVITHEEHANITGRFPAKTHYRSQVNDIAGLYMNRLIVNPVLFFFDKLRWIQHGDIHLYIGYILLAIILLLFFI